MAKKRKPRAPDPSLAAAGMMNDLLSRIDPDGSKVEPVLDAAGKDPAAVALGRRGGLKGGPARAAKLTAKQRKASAKNAAMARWQKG